MKKFGTLEYITHSEDVFDHKTYEKKGKRKYGKWRITGFMPTVIISRLVPDSWSEDRGVIEIADSPPNIEHLDMVMYRYPLDILTKEKWNERLKQMHQRFSIAESLEKLSGKEPSKNFIGTLLPFQKEGLEFLFKTNGRALLADEMGLGKTIQSIAFIASAQKSLPAIIISPVTVLRQWESEIKKFMKVKVDWQKKLEKFNIDLPKEYYPDSYQPPTTHIIRTGKQRELPVADFYIINYELVLKRSLDLIQTKPKTIIADEVQHLRNPSTDKYRGMEEITLAPSVNYTIGLSGTPIYNRGSEIWGIVDLIQKGLLSSYSEFAKTYCYSDYRGRDHVTSDKQQALAQLLRQSLMLRRLKKDVLKDLPEKTRYKQTIEIDQSKYQSEIEKIFNQIEEQKHIVNEASDDTQKKVRIMELNKLYVNAVQSERQIAGISKVPYIARHIDDMMEVENKIVVFVHHRLVHEMLRTKLAHFYPVHIIGNQNDKVRADAIKTFQEDEDCRLMIAGLRAGNVGINLTSASYVVHAELDWSPAIHRQAEDRLHRIGQKKEVFSYYLVGEGTLDDSIAEKLVDKSLEIDSVMGDEHVQDDKVKAEEKLRKLQQLIMKKKNK